MRKVVTHPNHCLPFMQPGRLVTVKYKDYNFGWGAVVSFTHLASKKGENKTPWESYIIDVLLTVSESSFVPTQANSELPPGIFPAIPGEKTRVEVVPVLLSSIASIGSLRIFFPKELKSVESRHQARKALEEAQRRFPDGIALLDPIENMGITDDSFKHLVRVRLNLDCCHIGANTR